MAKSMLNPFQPLADEGKPVAVVTDYQKDSDKYIIEYGEVERVKMTGDKDTDFIISKETVEISRTNRQDFLTSQSDDVGILNIIKKVALSGDTSLLNQTHRVGVAGSEKDALGRPVEDVVDVSSYQVDRVDAFEAYKKGASAYKDLPDWLGNGLSMEAVAKMSDDEILALIKSRVAPAGDNAAKGE